MNIHPTAIIDSKAELSAGITVGPYSIIGAGVKIGEGTEIGPHVTLEPGTTLGKNCRVFQGALIGGEPQVTGFDRDIVSYTEIGDNTTLREYVTVHRAENENAITRIGNNCMLMGYAHVAHDCIVGNHVTIVNYTGLSGYIVVEDYAFISGLVGLHQFVRIGTSAMIGGVTAVRQDILPYSTVAGVPLSLGGLNAVGLRRRNIKPEVRTALKKAIKFIKSDALNTSQAIEKIESEIEMHAEIRYLIEFIGNSKRGFVR